MQVWLILAGLLSAPGERQVELRFERAAGAESCPDEAAVTRSVTTRLGKSPFRAGASDRLWVRFARAGEGFSARVRLVDAKGAVLGQREIASEARDCSEVAAAAELAIAIAVDPQQQRARPGEPQSSTPASPPQPPPASGPAVSPPASGSAVSPPASGSAMSHPASGSAVSHPASGSAVSHPASGPVPHASGPTVVPGPTASVPPVPVTLGLGMGPRAVVGTGPALAGGLLLEVSAARGPWELEVLGRVELPTSLKASDGTVSMSALVGQVSPCYRGARAGACLLVSAGALRVSGQGFEREYRHSIPLVAAGVRGFIEHPLAARLALRAELSAEAQLIQTTVTVNQAAVWTSPPLLGSLGLSVIYRLW